MVLVTWQEFASGGRPQGGTIQEVVFSEVVNLVTKRRPLMAVLATGDARTTYLETLQDSLASRGHNAQVEGAAASDPDLTQPSRVFTHVQSFAKWGVVSDEQRMTAHYNEEPYSYHVSKKLTELLNDVEHALHRGSAITGATNAARQFAGLLNLSSSFVTASSGTTLTEQQFITYLQQWHDANLDITPRVAFVRSRLKRTISSFSTKITRNVDAVQKLQALVIERHSSDFGDVDIMLSVDQLNASSDTLSGNSLVIIDPDYFQVRWMKAPTVEPLARDGLRDRFQINAHCTLRPLDSRAAMGATGLVQYIST